MSETVESVMTAAPATVSTSASLVEVARLMRDDDIGAVLVVGSGNELAGIVSDRDVVIRGLAESASTTGEICSGRVVTVAPDDSVAEAVTLMRDNAVRRLPVVREGVTVGVISLGDIAVTHDPGSVLGQISDTEPNR